MTTPLEAFIKRYEELLEDTEDKTLSVKAFVADAVLEKFQRNSARAVIEMLQHAEILIEAISNSGTSYAGLASAISDKMNRLAEEGMKE